MVTENIIFLMNYPLNQNPVEAEITLTFNPRVISDNTEKTKV